MKTLDDVWNLKKIQEDGKENELLKKQILKYEELNKSISEQFDSNPRRGHGGTPNIVDNAKGRRMIRVCEKHEDRLRRLFELRDIQIEKIQKTCNSIIYKKYTRLEQTKKSKKFIDKNPINEILLKMQEDGIVKQWARNPQYFFMVDFKKVALFTIDGKVGISRKYGVADKANFIKIKEIIEKYSSID